MQPENLNENRVLNLTVPEQFAGMRLDQCLAQLHQESSRSRLQSLIKKGFVKLNEAICDSPKSSVAANDRIALVLPPEPEAFSAKAEQIDLDIMYEDEFMLVVNKPAGMVVHPGAGNWSGTLVNALLGHDPELAEDFGDADPARPGIVHRLDRILPDVSSWQRLPMRYSNSRKHFPRARYPRPMPQSFTGTSPCRQASSTI